MQAVKLTFCVTRGGCDICNSPDPRLVAVALFVGDSLYDCTDLGEFSRASTREYVDVACADLAQAEILYGSLREMLACQPSRG